MIKKWIEEKTMVETYLEYLLDVISSAFLGYVLLESSQVFLIAEKKGVGFSHKTGIMIFCLIYALLVAFPIKNRLTELNTIFNMCLAVFPVMLVNVAGLYTARWIIIAFVFATISVGIYDLIVYVQQVRSYSIKSRMSYLVINRLRIIISIASIAFIALYWFILLIGIVVFYL
ncbi:hypothetical protein CIY_34030 [Butyrivibrio fibrisolvens 16/4]|nr:hypothetical protein CIY_34030 [Butyrivibrio fibrisolvens 16/4]